MGPQYGIKVERKKILKMKSTGPCMMISHIDMHASLGSEDSSLCGNIY